MYKTGHQGGGGGSRRSDDFSELARYGSFAEVGFALAGSTNRYTYRSGAGGAGGGGNGNSAGVDTINAGVGGVQAEGTPAALNSANGFTATAAAQLDTDTVLDQWHVNNAKRNLQTPDSNDV